MKIKRALYIGNDTNYWNSVQHRFYSILTKDELVCNSMKPFGIEELNTKTVEVLDLRPDFIYFDLAKVDLPFYKFASFFSQLHIFADVSLVALVEDFSKLEPALLSGFDFVFVKDGELRDVVDHPLKLSFPKKVGNAKADFATAYITEESTLKELLRVSYCAADYCHVECDNEFEEGEMVDIELKIQSDLLLSKNLLVTNKSEKDLYYKYNFGYDLEYRFIPELNIDDLNDRLEKARDTGDIDLQKKKASKINLEIDEKKEDHANLKQKYHERMEQWAEEKQGSKVGKKTKVFIVDPSLDLVRNAEKPLDSFDFTIRTQNCFTTDYRLIPHYMPNIIVFEFPEYNVEHSESASELEIATAKSAYESDMIKTLQGLVHKVRSIKDYTPFIIIFNSQATSKAYQETFHYDLLITNTQKIDFKLILNMSSLYERKQTEIFEEKVIEKITALQKKDAKRYSSLTFESFMESKYYLKVTDPIAAAYWTHKMEIVSINESEVEIVTEKKLELDSYFLEHPFKMSVRFIPQTNGDSFTKVPGGKFQYRGLIHAISETQKMELRRYVNEIYTAHIRAEEAKEQQMIADLNERMREEKEEKEEK